MLRVKCGLCQLNLRHHISDFNIITMFLRYYLLMVSPALDISVHLWLCIHSIINTDQT